MQLSIVIPVYNVEKYIEDTLKSCITQNISKDDYEIIVINDGTPDDSMAIVQEYQQRNNNIIIINQENKGLSAARNVGLKQASGKYVWFIDSDDWIENNCLQELAQYMQSDIDMILIGGANVDNDTRQLVKHRNLFPNRHQQILSGKEAWRTGIRQISAAVFAIYRREFLISNNLTFIEGIYHEDNDFCPKASYLAEKIQVFSKIIYYVRLTPNSITRTEKPKRSYDLIKVSHSLFDFCETVKEKDIQRKFFAIIAKDINDSFYHINKCKIEEQKKFSSFLRNDVNTIWESLLLSHKLKYIIEWMLFLFIKDHLQVYKILKR